MGPKLQRLLRWTIAGAVAPALCGGLFALPQVPNHGFIAVGFGALVGEYYFWWLTVLFGVAALVRNLFPEPPERTASLDVVGQLKAMGYATDVDVAKREMDKERQIVSIGAGLAMGIVTAWGNSPLLSSGIITGLAAGIATYSIGLLLHFLGRAAAAKFSSPVLGWASGLFTGGIAFAILYVAAGPLWAVLGGGLVGVATGFGTFSHGNQVKRINAMRDLGVRD